MNTPTTELLACTGDLSVQQLGAFHTVLYIFKIVRSGKPRYLAEKLQLRQAVPGQIFPHRHVNTIQVHRVLTLSRSGFVYRGAQLWNHLPPEMRQESRLQVFKSQLREGFFIEAGADDLVTDSNTLFFEIERGWTGILVEPALWEKR